MTITDPEHPGQEFNTTTGNWEASFAEANAAAHDAVAAVPDVVTDIEEDPEVKAAVAALDAAKAAAEARAKTLAEAVAAKAEKAAPAVESDLKGWIEDHFDALEEWAGKVESRLAAIESPKDPGASSPTQVSEPSASSSAPSPA